MLFAQNVVTLALLEFGRSACDLRIESVDRYKARRWFPLVFLFYTMLASSMFALEYVTATTLIVQRNLATVTIAIADYFYLGTVQTKQRILAILGMCIGSVTYALDDLAASQVRDLSGYAWLALNVGSTTMYQIKVKSLVNELNMNSWTMAYYNNLLSLPVCVVICFARKEAEMLKSFFSGEGTPSECTTILVSCTLGFLLSVSAFQLNRLITPTSITILNNTNKFALICFTAYFMDYSSMSSYRAFGSIVVIACAAHYSYSGVNR